MLVLVVVVVVVIVVVVVVEFVSHMYDVSDYKY
jgi:hypothetical protein